MRPLTGVAVGVWLVIGVVYVVSLGIKPKFDDRADDVKRERYFARTPSGNYETRFCDERPGDTNCAMFQGRARCLSPDGGLCERAHANPDGVWCDPGCMLMIAPRAP